MSTADLASRSASSSVGTMLRQWRRRRRLSQLDLASEAAVSQRHLSFLESGRAAPSREMLLRLAEHLAVPLRERNALLVAGGFAPLYPARPLADPGVATVRQAVERILSGHEPHPALAVDRQWTLVFANRAVAPLLASVAPALLEPPVNVLRLSLHPDGLAPRIRNLPEWRGHLLARLQQQVDNSADPGLIALKAELQALPPPARPSPAGGGAVPGGVAVPLELEAETGLLSFISTTTVFGTALDVEVSELTIESFFPADAGTAAAMRRFAEAQPAGARA